LYSQFIFLTIIFSLGCFLIGIIFSAYSRPCLLKCSIGFAGCLYLLSLNLWFFFDCYQVTSFLFTFSGIVFGLDLLSIYYIVLTTLLTFTCCLLLINHPVYNEKNFIIAIFSIQFCLINIFSSASLFYFFIFFEILLIPTSFLIGLYGTNQRKVKALYLFIGFSLVSSVLFINLLCWIFSFLGTTNFLILKYYFITTPVTMFHLVIFWSLFIIFAIKLPIAPFHVWLPEAHVEAPTVGSIFLAGLLLKVGSYGFVKILYSWFLSLCIFFSPYIYVLIGFSIIISTFNIFRQLDLKRLIAYASIAHMNFALLGLFSFNINGFIGANLLFFAHSFTSSALFLLCGSLYDRFGTRNIYYFSGLVTYMPIFSIYFFLFNCFNGGFPCSLNFIAELLIGCGLVTNLFLFLFFGISICFSLIYSIWLFTRVCFNTYNYTMLKTIKLYDLNLNEIWSLLILLLFNGGLFFFPNFLILPLMAYYINL
jgi:proton-translocating NADH-quinone oxidoreductase chain M